jgi:hypothetical protein
MFEKVVIFAPLRAICENVLPFLERSTLNPVSLFELSVQERLIWLDDTAVAVRFVGAAGIELGVAVGVGVDVDVGLGLGVGGGVPVGVGVEVGVEVGVGLGVGVTVGTGVGVGVVLSIWTIFATEGTPFELRMNSI